MTGTLVFGGGTVVFPDEVAPGGIVVCEDGRIASAGAREDVFLPEGAEFVDAGDGFICPGFGDIHVHGGGGADVMDATLEAVVAVGRSHVRHGTTTFFPTTSTGSPEQIAAMIAACVEARDAWKLDDGARIGGVHLYGPYFAEDKVGCHPASGRRDPDPAEYVGYLDAGIVGIATCAAELPGAEEFYRAAETRGCLVTCGHSNASWEEMARAFDAGVRHVDHFWCAMSSIQSVRGRFGWPMQGSMAEFTLMNDEMSTEVIADLRHLAPELLEFAYRMKGPGRLCLVTDSSRALDMPPGEYVFGPKGGGELFTSDGTVGLVGGELASSVTGMDRMMRNMVETADVALADAVRMASLTPAERAGVDGDVGSLEEGKRADILILSGGLELERVFVGGVEVTP
jgi:N-acetylglucosamine-6-phosphate deacetylase